MAWMLLLCAAAPMADFPVADTLVICPAAFVAPLEPWIVHRTRQGHQVQLFTEVASAAAIRAAIQQRARHGGLRYVLLAGDAQPAESPLASSSAGAGVPTGVIPARVNIRWGSEPEIASDNYYADLDDDGLPELAVGRLSARTPADLQIQVRKILAYETVSDHGLWQRQINLVAGLGSFGALTDSVLELATKKFLTTGIPAAYQTSMTYGNWSSPYCPDPRRFRETTLRRLNEGCLFWIYLGHAHRSYLEPVQVPGGAFAVLDTRDAAQLNAVAGLPIALLLTCYAGAFDRREDCLAESLVRASGGPVAAICGSRVTMPYGMAVLADALLDEYFVQRQPTLGDLLLAAKRQMGQDESDHARRQLLDGLASSLSPAADQLTEERLEHVALFNLLGDPLLRLPQPSPIELEMAETARGGQILTVRGHCELAGDGRIELVCRRDRTRSALGVRRQFVPTHEFLQAFEDTYHQANDHVWLAQPFRFPGGPFELPLELPPECSGPCHVRAWVADSQCAALGAADVFVYRSAEQQLPVVREAGRSPRPLAR